MVRTKDLAAGGGRPVDQLPAGHELGGVKPKIKSRDDLALALQVISWINSRRKTVDARTEQQVQLIRETAKADLQLEVGGETITFDQRQADLEAAVSKYVLAKSADVFTDGTKTAKFPSGTVAIKAKAPWLQFEEGVTSRSVLDAMLAEHTLIAKGLAWLKRLGLVPWLRLKFELDVAGISKAIKQQEITAEDLAAKGMRFEGTDVVVITPADYAAAADGDM